MRRIFLAGLALLASAGGPSFAQWGSGYGGPPPGYYEGPPPGYGRAPPDYYRRPYEGPPPDRGYRRRYDDDYGDAPRYRRESRGPVGPTGLACVINPQYQHILRSCAAAAIFRPGQYCVCRLPNTTQDLPGTIR